MGEIDVTKVTAIEYLEKCLEIDGVKLCDWDGCSGCKYKSLSCAELKDISKIGIESHIENVMSFMIGETDINWTTVKKDTLIEVRERGDTSWCRRYFAKYKDGKVWAYSDGRTSKTTAQIFEWRFARIAEED